MLFVNHRKLELSIDGPARILVLDRLRDSGFIPLIRSMRLRVYEQLLGGSDRVRELEGAIAARTETEEDAATYLRGDIFCFEDDVLFLIFGDEGEGSSGMRAGVIYTASAAEPLRHLDSFCQSVRDALFSQGLAGAAPEPDAVAFSLSPMSRETEPAGFEYLALRPSSDASLAVAERAGGSERASAAELLEDDSTRLYLRRAREAQIEGCATKLLQGNHDGAFRFSMDKLLDAGLLERSVLVSCRKTGHTLFRLSSPDALAVITVSNATCSECGLPLADEKVEEVIAPTPLADSLLESGSWLVDRLYTTLRELGIPESDIDVGTLSEHGETRILARVCGAWFLFVLRDGDLTPVFARRAIDLELETDAAHLVIVATGRVHQEGRLRLLDHSRRRIRSGRDGELIIIEGPAAAAAELHRVFERISRRALAEQLCELDESLGLSVTRLVTTLFQVREESGAVQPAWLSAGSPARLS